MTGRVAAAAAGLAMLGGCVNLGDRSKSVRSDSGVRWGSLLFDAPENMLLFDYTDPGVFRYTTVEEYAGAMELFGSSSYLPPYRSPLALALLRDVDASWCDLTFAVRQTGREYPHRDLCFVFGYQDPAHFYYAHLASAADDAAHHVMMVNGADRAPITSRRSDGVRWGGADEWHKVRLQWRGGHVAVFFDDGAEPVLEADDDTFRHGRIGFGSFDDTGQLGGLSVMYEDFVQESGGKATVSDRGSINAPN